MTLFSLLSSGSLHLSSGKKIIPAEEFSALLSLKELLEKAQEELKQSQEEGRLAAEALGKQAEEAGFQKGLESFNEHLLALEQSARKIYLDTQKVVLSLALKAAQKIVKKELELHPDTIVDIVSHALLPAKQAKRVTIFVHKSDKEALEAKEPRLKEQLEQIQVLSIQERGDVSKGGCIIETETGIINASIENQWDALKKAFARYE